MMLGYFCIFSELEFQALRQGSKENLKKLYLHYKNPLLNFLLIHLKGNRTIAEDILHETFEIVINSPSKLKSQKKLRNWLLAITYKRLLLYYRKAKYDNAKIKLLQRQLDSIENESHIKLENKEKYFLLVYTLDKIKPIYKKVIEMKYIKGHSQKEMAESLKKTEGAIEQLLTRAKEAIKNEISVLHDNYFKKGGIVK